MVSGAGGVNSGAFTGTSSLSSNTSAAASSGGSWNARLRTHSKAQLNVASSSKAPIKGLSLSRALRAVWPRVASASKNFRKPCVCEKAGGGGTEVADWVMPKDGLGPGMPVRQGTHVHGGSVGQQGRMRTNLCVLHQGT